MALFREKYIRPASAFDQLKNYNFSGFNNDIAKLNSIADNMNTTLDDSIPMQETIYQDRIRQQNLPGFAYQPKEGLQSIINSQLQNAKTNVGQKVGQGMDFMGGIKDYIMGGGMLGMAAKGIGGLLSNIFQESPEQTNFRENIATDPEYQNLVNSIPGMSNYNQIFRMGSGRGLMGAADRRLATINKTLGRMTPQQLAQTSLTKRKAKLEALRELERQKEAAFLESQRRGRAPTAPSGGGSQDTGAADGFSPGQAGAGTGGYSYDSGGRQGFGYGLKDGGLASMFTRRG